MLIAAAPSLACDLTARRACPGDDAGKPVDAALLAFLSRGRMAHHVADQHEEQQRLDEALSVLEAFASGPQPPGEPAAPEVREVLADTQARKADLESRLGRFEAAERSVAAGLGLVPETSYFRGHLFEVQGMLEERRAKSLRQAGDGSGAEQAQGRALEAFARAMAIQEQVIEKAIESAPPRTP
jgi:tetratricopeptide (TPR) repeat protein